MADFSRSFIHKRTARFYDRASLGNQPQALNRDMESVLLTLKGRSERGKEPSMGRFGLSDRIVRCRSLCGSFRKKCTAAARKNCKSSRAEEMCEVTFDVGVSITQRTHVLSQAELFFTKCAA